MTDSLTLYLPRTDKVKKVKISWNGHIQTVWQGEHLQPTHTYLWELDEKQRDEKLQAIARRLDIELRRKELAQFLDAEVRREAIEDDFAHYTNGM
jgi:hypothetical protein